MKLRHNISKLHYCLHILYLRYAYLPQIGFDQPTIDIDDLAGRLGKGAAQQEVGGLSLIFGEDGQFGQRALGIELGQAITQGFGVFAFAVGNFVFYQ